MLLPFGHEYYIKLYITDQLGEREGEGEGGRGRERERERERERGAYQRRMLRLKPRHEQRQAIPAPGQHCRRPRPPRLCSCRMRQTLRLLPQRVPRQRRWRRRWHLPGHMHTLGHDQHPTRPKHILRRLLHTPAGIAGVLTHQRQNPPRQVTGDTDRARGSCDGNAGFVEMGR